MQKRGKAKVELSFHYGNRLFGTLRSSEYLILCIYIADTAGEAVKSKVGCRFELPTVERKIHCQGQMSALNSGKLAKVSMFIALCSLK